MCTFLSKLFLIISFCFLCSFASLGQNMDSIAMVSQLKEFQFSEGTSVSAFWDLYLNYQHDLSNQAQISFGLKGANAAEKYKNDTLYVAFYLKVIEIYTIQLYDLEQARLLLNLISDRIALLDSKKYKGLFYNFKGAVYFLEGNYNDGLNYYMKSYENSKSVDPERAKGTLYNISKVYNRLGDYQNGIKFAKEALLLNEKLSKRAANLNTAFSNHLISLCYEGKEQMDTAFYHSRQAILALDQLDTLNNFRELQMYCEVNMDLLHYYLHKKNQLKIDSILQAVVKCKGKVEPLYSLALANYYLTIKDFEQAGKIIYDTTDRGENYTAEHYRLYLESVYQEGIGNYQEALKAERAYSERQKANTKEKILQYTAFADARFDAIKNQEELTRLTLTNEKENLKFRILFFTLLLSLVILVMGIFAYRKLKHQVIIIEKQSEELAKLGVLKSKLFTNISHELRTPLTLISEPIKNLLEQGNLDNNTENQLLLAQRSSKQLLALSDQIMDLIKSENGEIRTKLVRFHVNDFLDNICSSFKISAKNKGLSFLEEKHYEGNILIQTDAVKLKIILNNLIQNAVKYNKDGGKVRLDSFDRREQIVFCVSDTGRGISEQELPFVFDRYYQSKENTKIEGGFGIGLAICKEYVELLGGTIRVESKLEEGTKFWVNIPKIKGDVESVIYESFDFGPLLPVISLEPTKTLTPQNTQHKHLLIVEDNEDLCDFLQTILGQEYILSFASNGKEGLEKLEKITPSLIITDWMMPIMDGLNFVQKLKNDLKFMRIPVLMLTARSRSTDQLKAIRIGINDYLLKPFDANVLKLRIEQLLKAAQELELTNENTQSPILDKTNSVGYKISNKKDIAWIHHLEEIVYKYISDFDLVADTIAAEVNLSTTQLNRKVKGITGLTTIQFVDETRFWEARRLLEEKEVFSVKAVSYSVGFKSVKNFSRNFKKRFGKNPSDLIVD